MLFSRRASIDQAHTTLPLSFVFDESIIAYSCPFRVPECRNRIMPVMLSTIEMPVSSPTTKSSGGWGGKNRLTRIAALRQIIPMGDKCSSFRSANLRSPSIDVPFFHRSFL